MKFILICCLMLLGGFWGIKGEEVNLTHVNLLISLTPEVVEKAYASGEQIGIARQILTGKGQYYVIWGLIAPSQLAEYNYVQWDNLNGLAAYITESPLANGSTAFVNDLAVTRPGVVVPYQPPVFQQQVYSSSVAYNQVAILNNATGVIRTGLAQQITINGNQLGHRPLFVASLFAFSPLLIPITNDFYIFWSVGLSPGQMFLEITQGLVASSPVSSITWGSPGDPPPLPDRCLTYTVQGTFTDIPCQTP